MRRVLALATTAVTAVTAVTFLAGCQPVDAAVPAPSTGTGVVRVTESPAVSEPPTTEPTGAPSTTTAPPAASVLLDTQPATVAGAACGPDYYRNVDGVCVRRPVQVAPGDAPPAGATARCNDGSYSYSQHRQGTCSHHGGVAVWY